MYLRVKNILLCECPFSPLLCEVKAEVLPLKTSWLFGSDAVPGVPVLFQSGQFLLGELLKSPVRPKAATNWSVG